jgi:hypothetical protein
MRKEEPTMMTLVNFESLAGGCRLDYLVKHSTPGREGTTLEARLALYIRPDTSWCEMKIEDCEGPSHTEALDKMASWLRRLADGIEQRKETPIPM